MMVSFGSLAPLEAKWTQCKTVYYHYALVVAFIPLNLRVRYYSCNIKNSLESERTPNLHTTSEIASKNAD